MSGEGKKEGKMWRKKVLRERILRKQRGRKKIKKGVKEKNIR